MSTKWIKILDLKVGDKVFDKSILKEGYVDYIDPLLGEYCIVVRFDTCIISYNDQGKYRSDTEPTLIKVKTPHLPYNDHILDFELQQMGTSMGNEIKDYFNRGKKVCTCEYLELVRFGCKCGCFESEMKAKERGKVQ